ncbi:MAG: SCO family protein [Bacteroidota bacterium]
MYLIEFFKKSKSTIIFIIFFSFIFVPIIFFLVKPKTKLPVYNPADVNPILVDDAVKHIRRDHRIADFSLLDQNGDTITQDSFKDKIYVADFFFTRCQTICPVMTLNMSDLQAHFKNDEEVKFLSHSVTPIIDSVSVLRAYADEKGVIDEKWHITTGKKMHIYELARKSYFAVLDEGDGGEQDFIHTEQFILVDKNRQIRGFYDGTDKDEMQRIIKDIDILKKEYNQN